jgi:hypothetical protein
MLSTKIPPLKKNKGFINRVLGFKWRLKRHLTLETVIQGLYSAYLPLIEVGVLALLVIG